MNTREIAEKLLKDSLDDDYVFQNLSENIETALNEAKLEGLREAQELAFGLEAKYIPSKDDPCCKCDKSHAKADGAADVVDAIGRAIKKLLGRRKSDAI